MMDKRRFRLQDMYRLLRCGFSAAIISISLIGCSGAPAIAAVETGMVKPSDSFLASDPYASERPCAGFYAKSFRPVIGRVSTPPPKLARPAKGKVFSDPVFKTCVVRVTNAAKEPPPTFARNDYSRRQPFNADDTLILVYALNGSWHLYDARTLKYVKKLRGPGGDAEPQWHPTDPRTLYYLPNNGGMVVYALDVKTDRKSIKVDFSRPDSRGFRVRDLWPTAARIWTRSEGSPSADGRYWAFQVENNQFKILGLITYDMKTNTILGKYSTKSRPDHVSISPSGKYVVVPWGKHSSERGPVVFTRDLKNRRSLTMNLGHSDLALDSEGKDVLVSVDHTRGYVYMTHLDTGKTTKLFYIWPHNTTMAMHFSGKAFRKPGWVLLSTFGRGHTEWPHQKVFALELKDNPRVVNLMHHHDAGGDYFAQPQAAVNRNFTRLVVNSNWDMRGRDHVDVYMVEIPKGVF
jgi:hypothetical protein